MTGAFQLRWSRSGFEPDTPTTLLSNKADASVFVGTRTGLVWRLQLSDKHKDSHNEDEDGDEDDVENVKGEGGIIATGEGDWTKDFIDTKAGSIQTVWSHPIQQTMEQTQWPDVAIGHACGRVTFFANGQIVAGHQMGVTSVSAMTSVTDKLGTYLVASDQKGTLSAYRVHEVLWRTRLSDICAAPKEGVRSVAALLHAHITDRYGYNCPTLIVADSMSEIHFLHQSEWIHTIKTPANITSMMQVHTDGRDRILCGGDDGLIYEILPDPTFVYSLKPVANVGYSIRNLHKATAGFLVMATGNYDFLAFWDGKQIIRSPPLSDWVHTATFVSDSKICALTVDGAIHILDYNQTTSHSDKMAT